jgi:hypothetical protein
LSLMSLTSGSSSRAARSNIGAIARQGPHHPPHVDQHGYVILAAVLLESRRVDGGRMSIEQRAVTGAAPSHHRRLAARNAVGGRTMRAYNVTSVDHGIAPRPPDQAGSFTLRRFSCSSTKRS